MGQDSSKYLGGLTPLGLATTPLPSPMSPSATVAASYKAIGQVDYDSAQLAGAVQRLQIVPRPVNTSTSTLQQSRHKVTTQTQTVPRFEYDHYGSLISGDHLGAEFKQVTRVVAIDCEMVGVGGDDRESVLARVSIVNQHGFCLYDTFVKPTLPVTEYRTEKSGVREDDLVHGKLIYFSA